MSKTSIVRVDWPPSSYALTQVVLLATFCSVMPTVLWLQTFDGLTSYFDQTLPPGQIAYVASKLFGLYAVAFVGLQVFVGLSLPITGRVSWHIMIGIVAGTFLALHVILFVLAASLRAGAADLALLVPNWSHGFYRTSVSLGVVGFWGLLVVMMAGVSRYVGLRRLGKLHYLALPCYLLVLCHSLLIGTETRYVASLCFYGVLIFAVIVALVRRTRKQRETQVELIR